ncbi:MAG: sporulation peptidase YabG [Clostridia bacterium]|nr:sporulation peptidase YabG [Clostridia bacterium]
MSKIKEGDIVARKSHGKDVIFVVKRIIRTSRGEIVILNGAIERIEADAPIDDLEKLDRKVIHTILKNIDEKIERHVAQSTKQNYKVGILLNENRIINTSIKAKASILHLDGDKRYAEKSSRYYKKMGLQAVVKNVPENKQPQVVYNLLKVYKPDILVITGHDGMIKKQSGYSDIYNYRNSKYFIETVKEARKYDEEYKRDLVIFAGACQSFFEALILAGANFASSPARILIDFLDPLIVAKEVATTDRNKLVTVDGFEMKLRDGKKGIDGIGAKGKKCEN